MRKPWRIAATALFAVALLIGGLTGDRLLALGDETRQSIRQFTEMITTAHDAYGGEVSYRDLVYASIDGMLRQLDPHTNFLSSEAYDAMRERQQSSFYGLGILVGMRDGQLTVITPIEGTPASRMGLRAGDVISRIEGEPTTAYTINEAVRLLKGPKGTEVNITIVRRGLDVPLELTITRDEIPQETVRYKFMMTEDVGYIMLVDFARSTGEEIEQAINELKAQGMTKLLLDLRGNGGGLLDQAIEVADQFVPQGAAIVATRGRTRPSHQEYKAAGERKPLDLPVVVLVSSATASAAEILAGAIQDHDIGLIVGTPTWGKGLVQTVYSLSYGAGLALTTAKYYTPSGRLIQRDYTSWFDYANHGNGSVASLEREEFRTDLGRKVYGGGGITPDVEVEPGEIPPFIQYLMSRNAFFNYSVLYSNTHGKPERDWEPPSDLLDQFKEWAVAETIATATELDEGLADEVSRNYALLRIKAEIFNAAYGLEARFKALAGTDEQIREALAQFDAATALLAARQSLDEDRKSAEVEVDKSTPASKG